VVEVAEVVAGVVVEVLDELEPPVPLKSKDG
jgi:hypothetical protein